MIFNRHSVTVCFMSGIVALPCRFNTALKPCVMLSDGHALIKVALLMDCLCVILKRELLGLEVRSAAGRRQ